MDSDRRGSLPSSLRSLLNPAPRRSSTSHSGPRDSSTRTTLTSHSELAALRDSFTRTTLSPHSEDSGQKDGPSRPFRPPPPLYVPSSTSNPRTADDRQLQTVPFENSDYRSLEPSSSSNLNFPSNSLELPKLHFPSSQSSPANIQLPDVASLEARIFEENSSWGWREGEAGPSSLVHPGQRDYDSHHQHVASQPARVTPSPNTFGYGSMSREPQRRNTGYYPTPHHSIHDRPDSPMQQDQHLGSIPPSHPERRFSYPQLDLLSISDPRQVSTPEPSYGSEPVSVNIEGDDAHKNKKRRAHSMGVDNMIPKKPSRKTAVACNFCRGRKLRCNGAKPSCYNCTVRKFECEYVSTQRRRGPGKAPKGSRSRKGRSEPSANIGDPSGLPTTVPDYVSPDLRPFLSVLTLETYQPRPERAERRASPTSSAEDLHRG